MLWVPLQYFNAAEEVLDRFRDDFIANMNAKDVIYSLETEGIISDGNRDEVKHAEGARRQNEILHAQLKRNCTEEALMTVCHKIIAVGNPKMKKLGNAMLSMLTGKCASHSSKHECEHLLLYARLN